jgi:phosphoribosyl-AMP cyclohydrolase
MSSPDFNKQELIPAIVQNVDTGRVLMLAYMNKQAFDLTKETGLGHFWSRSRQEIWKKGSTSGNTLLVSSIELDCDADSILLKVTPSGPSCHTGLESCFDSASISVQGNGDLYG